MSYVDSMVAKQPINPPDLSQQNDVPKKPNPLKTVYKLQRQERVSHFFVLIISLALIVLLFVILRVV